MHLRTLPPKLVPPSLLVLAQSLASPLVRIGSGTLDMAQTLRRLSSPLQHRLIGACMPAASTFRAPLPPRLTSRTDSANRFSIIFLTSNFFLYSLQLVTGR